MIGPDLQTVIFQAYSITGLSRQAWRRIGRRQGPRAHPSLGFAHRLRAREGHHPGRQPRLQRPRHRGPHAAHPQHRHPRLRGRGGHAPHQLPSGHQGHDAPRRALRRHRGLRPERTRYHPYHGLKEQVALADFPDDSVYEELGLDRERPVVVLRPPATMSLYHRGIQNTVFDDVVARLIDS